MVGVAPDGMVAFPRLELMLARNNADWYQRAGLVRAVQLCPGSEGRLQSCARSAASLTISASPHLPWQSWSRRRQRDA